MRTDVASTAPPWWFLVLAPLLTFALVFAAFAPALSGRFLQWDDMAGVAQNEELRRDGAAGLAWRFSTRHMGHYQPLSWWSLSLDVEDAPAGELGDAAAARCHRTNLLLHALGAAAFALLAERLLRAAVRGSQSPPSDNAIALAALFASLAWALHPLRVESVAWITERRDVLSAVPLLLSTYLYMLWADGRAAPLWRPRLLEGGRTPFLVASFALLSISLLAKAWGIVVPALLVVLDFYPLRRCTFTWRSLVALLIEKAPFIVLSLVFAVLAAWAQASQPDAMPDLSEHTLAERGLQAMFGLCFYVWKSIAPTGLMPLYELPRDVSIADARFLLSAIALPAAVALCFALRRRLPSLIATAAAAAILVSPVLGFAQAGPQLAADRYTYLFGLALSVLLAGALLEWSRVARWIPCVVGAALLALFGYSTRAQTAIWHDTESLWSHVLAHEAKHVVGNLSLGNEYARLAFELESVSETARGLHRAEGLFTTGLDVSGDPRCASRLALLHIALVSLEPDRAGEHQRLASEYSELAVELAIATGRVKPETRLAHGINLLSLGRVKDALVELEWYVQQRPDDPRGKLALDQARSQRASTRDQ